MGNSQTNQRQNQRIAIDPQIIQNTNREFAMNFVRSNADLNEQGFFHHYFQPNMFDKIKLKKTKAKTKQFRLLKEITTLNSDGILEAFFQHKSELKVQLIFNCYFKKENADFELECKSAHLTKTFNFPVPNPKSKLVMNLSSEELAIIQKESQERVNFFPLLIVLNSEVSASERNGISFLFYPVRKSEFSQNIVISEEYTKIKDKIFLMSDVFGVSSEFGYGDNISVSQKNSRDSENKSCIICFTKKIDCLLIPCRHLSLCFKCSKSLQMTTNKCPICRDTIREIVKIYPDKIGKNDQSFLKV